MDKEKRRVLEVRAREQADGLNHWAAVLEAHEPESSAAGIVMLREAAKTLRELAADAPPEPTDEMARKVWREFWDTGSHPVDIQASEECFDKYWAALRAALATQQKGDEREKAKPSIIQPTAEKKGLGCRER